MGAYLVTLFESSAGNIRILVSVLFDVLAVEVGLHHGEPRSVAVSRTGETRNMSPKPPPPIDDSTSALEYKRSHHARPPPLPAMDLPRSRTAEEAVTNILYNTPPPSLQPFKRHVLNCLVQNEPGVLSRVSGILAGRGFNIDSLVVCRTEIRDLSRMCIVLRGQDGVIEQARRQLEDLVSRFSYLPIQVVFNPGFRFPSGLSSTTPTPTA
ncbi:hypothetical protein NM688_g4651 [Phlebia brevispora]|uniref:Uncharacterized protein n=1 Tax=Phlebia brevispora TaxID=194682 RepID=A0ACC1T216_9APHY|nr:hypothetical protein NM688_g4651 [Phlebia brevispora]